MRVGIGFDQHKFVRGRKLILGGVEIPFDMGLEGNSDADVLIHAIIDSLLGAAGLRDIGYYFPPDDERYKDISSLKLLKKAVEIIKEKGWEVNNVDAVLFLSKPKVSGYIEEMKKKLAPVLEIPEEDIGIKATSPEGIGAIGRGEGIACWSVCLLVKGIRK
ncbi:MAG: 2-C-methyl-D-erythritol 2,4-cyclodiphosphate synthase [Caldiserica bacterium]|nr:MAG: 2-C-methyl-D-erythritol 2,4-cyclodiphosphate synthase [Caldisericota bacterium]